MYDCKIVPMEPSVSPQVPDGDYFYQVKWDGIRILAFGSSGELYLQGKKLKDKTELYPELSLLLQLIDSKKFILDGEIITLQKGRPCFYSLMQREKASSFSLSALSRKFPVSYMVFDLLYLHGDWLLNLPLEERLNILWSNLRDEGCIHLNKSFSDGESLLESVKEKNMEGIVSKQRHSPYIPGPGKSSYWLKTKLEQTLEAYVGGVLLKNQRLSSLLLGLEAKNAGAVNEIKFYNIKDDKQLLYYIGGLSSGLKEKELNFWHSWARANKKELPTFINPPSLRGRDIIYVKPVKKIKISFSEWTPDLKLRAPRIKR